MARTTDRIKQIQLNEKDISDEIRNNIEEVIAVIPSCRNGKDAVKYMLSHFVKMNHNQMDLQNRYDELKRNVKNYLANEENLNYASSARSQYIGQLEELIKKDRY